MFATNLVLLLAFVAMIAGAVWLFRDGEGKDPKASLPNDDDDNAGQGRRVRVIDADAEPGRDRAERG